MSLERWVLLLIASLSGWSTRPCQKIPNIDSAPPRPWNGNCTMLPHRLCAAGADEVGERSDVVSSRADWNTRERFYEQWPRHHRPEFVVRCPCFNLFEL